MLSSLNLKRNSVKNVSYFLNFKKSTNRLVDTKLDIKDVITQIKSIKELLSMEKLNHKNK